MNPINRNSLGLLGNAVSRVTGLCTLVMLLTGCAGVKFYQTLDLKQKTGIKVYTAKPYLLVTHTGSKDNPEKVEIVQLPDLSRPYYARYRAGWGTHEFALKLQNGILTEYNQKTDSKGPETLKALADGFSTAASAYTGLMAPPKKESASIDPSISALQSAQGLLRTINEKTDQDLGTFSGKKQTLNGISSEIGKVIDSLTADPKDKETAAKSLEKIKTSLDDAKIKDSQTLAVAVAINAIIDDSRNAVNRAIILLREAKEDKPGDKAPVFELYEIVEKDGATQLIKVRSP